MRRNRTKEEFETAFWSRVKTAGHAPKHNPHLGQCHEWTGSKNKGYGRTSRAGIQAYCHKISWEIKNGKVPDGLFVLHKCDNRACVRVDHLFLGTTQDNADDMVKKNRQATKERNKRFQKYGDSHPAHKITEEDAKQIFQLRHERLFAKTIAKTFQISRSQVHNILSGYSWPHLSNWAAMAGYHVYVRKKFRLFRK